jgi:acyl-CoA reductase-like NAD-dependent aldehyde dehydrogenase
MSTFTVLNPATEETVATVPSTSAEETDAAIARAVAAQAAWRAVAPGERAALLRAFADTVDAHNEELAGLEVAGSGHPVGQARWEAGNVRDVLRYYSAAPERLCGRQIPVPGGVNVTFQEPVGVVGLIVPWNFPMPILGWGLGPALAAGNPVIAKPAERTPLTAIRIGELAREAGLPDGVFQVLPGKGSVVGQRLVDHEHVRKIVFTGSTEVGQQIMAGCARHVKRLTLELGGKSANIVFADADLDAAVRGAANGIFYGKGEICAAGSRLLVQRPIYDTVIAKLKERAEKSPVGDPMHPKTRLGSLVREGQMNRVLDYIAKGKNEVHLTLQGKLIVLFSRFMPWFVDMVTKKKVRSLFREGIDARRPLHGGELDLVHR